MTLLELLRLLRRRLALVIALPLACALAVGAYSSLAMPDTYTASSTMYVMAKAGASADSVTSQELNASQLVANDVAKLLKSDRVVDEAGSKVGVAGLKGYKVEVAADTASRVLKLSVTGEDPKVAADAANAMVDIVSGVARDVMGIEAVNSVDPAVAPAQPSGPRRALMTAAGAAGGLFAAVAASVLLDVLDTKIRGQRDLEEAVPVPVIGRIPAAREGR